MFFDLTERMYLNLGTYTTPQGKSYNSAFLGLQKMETEKRLNNGEADENVGPQTFIVSNILCQRWWTLFCHQDALGNIYHSIQQE